MTLDPHVFRVFFGFTCLLLCVYTLDVQEVCYEECGSRVVLDEDDFDVACNDTCKVQKCHEGCDSWLEAITFSCQDVCGEEWKTYKKKWNLYCVMGCNIAINIYIKRMEDEIGTPSAPYLVADSKTNDSAIIQWAPGPYSNISYLVQWRYDSPYLAADWEYYNPLNTLRVNNLEVNGLQPFTNYRFRVAWILLLNYSPLFSEESVVIHTLPYGVPSTSPTITSLTAVGCTRVSISWDPPAFPNGPILSYVLYLREYPNGFITIKDVFVASGGLHYMFNDLRPFTTYVISVATRNNMGEGPIDTKNVTTPSKEETSSSYVSRPNLVFAAKQNVVMQGQSLFDETLILYQPTNDSILVAGVALHVKYNLFFLSDTLGYVHRVPLQGEHRNDSIIKANPNFPSILSVDWLNDHLYMVEENQISRCNFKGENYEIVVIGFEKRPTDMHVDPYNGYLYWVVHGIPSGGLYRMDLETVDLGIVSYELAQHIVKDSRLAAFTVDYKNFRLLCPSSDQNTIISVALDGSDGVDIRRNTQTPQFNSVNSIAVHSNIFYWTTITEVYREEYHPKEDLYYNNAYLVRDGPFCSINIHHSEYQPHPVPLNPVVSVQAVFEDDMAKIAWSRPRLLGGLGRGAWQNWLYEVHLFDHSTELTIFGMNISENSCSLHNLRPNTTYSVKVRAYSLGGKGPWSSEFIGKTLKADNLPGYPYVLWSAREGVLKSNIVGDNVEPLIHKINLNNAHVTDISWYNGLLFLNTNASWVYMYNMSIHYSLTRLTNITNAASIALDWLAPKLYWSSPAQQMISRANLDGSQPEPLPILTMAQELAIDSPKGYMYWATSHNVESSRLNGADHYIYMKNELFSGKHVMGLTLDFDRNRIYWMVRSYEGSLMYRAPLANDILSVTSEIVFELVGPLPEDDVQGPLWYFSDRLFWLHEHKEALVSDIYGHNVASLRGLGLNGLRTLTVVDPSLQPYPDDVDHHTIRVVPSSVVDKTIGVKGTWDSFNITWDAVNTVNYGSLFYEMKIDDGEEIYTMVTEDPVFVYPSMRLLSPYTALTIAVKAYTYWASSRQTVVSIYSPMSTPTKPLHPRIFITYKTSPLHDNQEIQAKFRWSAPEYPNGVILGYQVVCWFFVNGKQNSICHDTVGGDKLQFNINGLEPNSTYYFQVKAFTEIGFGPPSDITQAQTSREYPVPQLLLAKIDAVKVADIDTHEEKLLSSKATHPAAVAYLALEKRVFWIEEGGALMASSLDGTNTTLMRSLSAQGTTLSVDWIGRHLYWAEVDKEEEYSTVWSMDLSLNGSPRSILNRSDIVGSLEVEPFSGSLVWTVMNDKQGQLMICDSDGFNVRPFFWQSLEYQANSKFKVKRTTGNKSCNCPPRPVVDRAITIDSTNASQPQVLWVDGRHGHIWTSDLQGCICQLLVNATESRDNGLPPTSLTVDSARIYWSNTSLGKVYSMSKLNEASSVAPGISSTSRPLSASHYKNYIISETVRGIRGIRAIGDHLQPYPDPTCLSPSSYKETAKLITHSSTSLTIYLPKVHRPDYCSKLSISSVRFTVYYGTIGVNEEQDCSFYLPSCKVLSTYNSSVTLHGLRPFTNYSIQVAISNYYSQGMTAPGPVAVYQTREGAPTAPVNVSAKAVTPYRIDVYWLPPLIPNGSPIWYEVRSRTENPHKTGESSSYTHKPETYEDQLMMSLNARDPGTKYYIIVRAYSSGGDMHSDSEEVVVTTYKLPNNLTLMNITSRSLIVSWLSPKDSSISYHGLEYSQVSTTQWHLALTSQSTVPDTCYNFTVNNLHPKTDYHLRLLLTYSAKEITIVWPRDQQFTFETQGDKPDMPGEPQVRNIGRDVYQVMWNEAQINGGEELIYELQMRSQGDDSSEWTTIYNNSNTQWIMESMLANAKYEFRVRAMNEYGESNYSFSGEPFFLPEPGALIEHEEDQVSIILASSISSIIILLILFIAVMYMIRKQHEKDKKVSQEAIAQNQLTPDLELATLQELPRHGNFVHQNNALYNLGEIPTDEELISLPQIQRDQIILTKFLGSGAFGEVFEGIAHDLEEDLPPMKVAIKTLRKGATDHEKTEFLKEAKLMSNFKHDHILKLLGVCFDNNPNFIILELMEGGDLLSFLRSNRPTIFHPSTLSLEDLLGICVDVAKGCKYLEDMHFVHRDLAARNCLVSSYDRESRIVKIGDFGLARDIYKNDYYRKEGEGLLPVRWMAPESLVYGVFTSQSDVWAFGVLLWEVMTLGQQPYPARANVEVLHYVRAGGRLDKPENCPEDLHQVMTHCWSYHPDDRPAFTYCLDALEDLRDKSVSSPLPITTVHNHNYSSHSYNGFDNLGYRGDEQTEVLFPEPLPIERAAAGVYIKTNRERNREWYKPPVVPRDIDSLSTQSDPAGTSDLLERHEVPVKRASSLSYPPIHSELEEPTTSQASAALPSMRTIIRSGCDTSKYLELLADSEDTDGYEIPLHVSSAKCSFIECRHRCYESSQTNSTFTSTANTTIPLTNHQPEDSNVLSQKPLSAPSAYTQVCPNVLTVSELSDSFGYSCLNQDNTDDKNEQILQAGCSSRTEYHNSSSSHKTKSPFSLFLSVYREKQPKISNIVYHHNINANAIDIGLVEDRIEVDGKDLSGSLDSIENDHWSLSTSSTVPCEVDSSQSSHRNSGISTLSAISGIELNYVPKSSWC